jgi:hypothetical protein
MGKQTDDFPTEWAIPEFIEERNSSETHPDSNNDLSLARNNPQESEESRVPEV